MSDRINWNNDHYNLVKNNIKGTPYKKLHEMFMDEFNIVVPFTTFSGYISRNKLKNGIDARRKKGQTPWNKGMKGIHFKGSEKGWFKKGVTPPKKRAVGEIYEPKDKEDYVLIKVDDTGVKNHDWRPLQHVIYMKHYGEIPSGYAVVFLNKDNRDFRIENLKAVSRQTLVRINNRGIIEGQPEYNTALINLAEISEAIKNIKGVRV